MFHSVATAYFTATSTMVTLPDTLTEHTEFCRVMLCISADYAYMRCLSDRPVFVTFVYCISKQV